MQCCPPSLLGSLLYQLAKVTSGALAPEPHRHVPSDAASVKPIHTAEPAAAVLRRSLSSDVITVASCAPNNAQSASASVQVRGVSKRR